MRQYQVTADPGRLQARGIPLRALADAIRDGSRDVGDRSVELAEIEYMVRGRGYPGGPAGLEMRVLKSAEGVPVRIGDVARVEEVPAERRGVAELDGEGEVAGRGRTPCTSSTGPRRALRKSPPWPWPAPRSCCT